MTIEIAVVGSLNLDTTAQVRRLPRPGETVLGSGHFTDTGGKGANQAVAAARLGRRTAMIGKLGADDAGRRIRGVLDTAGVDTRGVVDADDVPTGIALITVDAAGENTIVVSPGANAAVTVDDVARSAAALQGASVVLAQLEVPLDAVARAGVLAAGRFVLNPAPAQPLDHDLLRLVDVLVPNETELALLAGSDAVPASIDETSAMARELGGPGAIVVTLGSQGALVVEDGGAEHVRAPSCRPWIRRPPAIPSARASPTGSSAGCPSSTPPGGRSSVGR